MARTGKRKDIRRVGLICSVQEEASLIEKALRGEEGSKALREAPVRPALSVSGVGAVNTARALAVMAETLRPELVVIFGIGGAYSGCGLGPGDLAVAKSEVYADLGAPGKDGFPDMREIGIPLVESGKMTFYNEFPLDRSLVQWAKKTLGPEVVSGTFLTISSLPATEADAAKLGSHYGAVCENMEGAAAAQICAIYNIPMLEIRGISNMAGVRDKKKWKIKKASENCQRAVIKLLKSI